MAEADEDAENTLNTGLDSGQVSNQNIEEDVNSQVGVKSSRYLTLKSRKKAAKCRLTKARNHIDAMTTGHPSSKTEIRRAIKKVIAERDIVEKLIQALKETVTLSEDETLEGIEIDNVIENLDQELLEILDLVDTSVQAANEHIRERLLKGENESDSSTIKSSKSSVKSNITSSSNDKIPKSVKEDSIVEVREQEARDANERLEKLEEEQRSLEEEMRKKADEVELNRKRVEDARSIALLNETRARAYSKNSKKATSVTDDPEPLKMCLPRPNPDPPSYTRVKLKGVELRNFSGDDKTDFEAWNAAFTSVVDETNMPVKEKMLRLQNCLKGKALETVKDLGFTQHAYERAKEKLQRKYGGKRRQTLTHLAALRALPKVRRHNLEELETLLSTLDRILIALQDDDRGDDEIRSQHLCLTVKEKLSVEYVREYKYWLNERDEDDDFKMLVQWIERRVCIMDEAKEETEEFVKAYHGGRRHNQGFNTDKKVRKCIVMNCDADHPPWVCPEFKKLPVATRNQLIAKTGRCFSCLAAGHRSKQCGRKRKCGVSGCESKGHSSLLHDPERMEKQNEDNDNNKDQTNPSIGGTDARTYTTNRVEQISLMVLPATVEIGGKKIKINVMLDPCSTGSYVTESLVGELHLKGEKQDLTISGTGGTEIKRQSKRVKCVITSVNGTFSSPVEANVLTNVTGNTPAIEWNELKGNWAHLETIPFERVSKRKQIDVLIGSDHPLVNGIYSIKY
ncbi:uncharacterized protein LOC114533077 [Dendronephthya gigantea]|uniref:uncharacterized protein LOC114533077 n=1 Tax=Dendronephthya gigantea TaxID=151771 RepID=UPI00106972DA|nr:uncharacterized protein LOC114533077 [Dendronephthya gigantea]